TSPRLTIQSPPPGTISARSRGPATVPPVIGTKITASPSPWPTCSSGAIATRAAKAYSSTGASSSAMTARASVDPPLVPLPLALAQGELLHLAGRGLRQWPERDRVGALVVRDLSAAEGDELALAQRRAVLERHEGLRALAPA